MIALSVLDIAAMVGGTITDAPWYDSASVPNADQPLGAGSHNGQQGTAGLEVPQVSTSVVVDSRLVVPGCLFVALPGESVDGHQFADAAVQAGAVAVLASRPVGVPAIVVPDVQVALGRLAREVIDRLNAVVVGVTGSSGKTSTKDLLAQVLSRLGPVVAPPGSFNNEVGLPLTVLRADDTTRVLVLEFGARGLGHISTLTQIAPPQVGIVLNVGSAHVGEFGSPEVTATAKSELVQALPPAASGGVAVLNADDSRVAAMATATQAQVMRVGIVEGSSADLGTSGTVGIGSDMGTTSDIGTTSAVGTTSDQRNQAHERNLQVWAQNVRLDALGRAEFELVVATGENGGVDSALVSLQVVGRHQVSNALQVASAARALGMSVSEIAQGLSQAVATSRWRMEVCEREDGLTIVNDAYNANPESMRAAIQATAALGAGAGDQPLRRLWAVVGAMRELGDQAESAHQAVGQQLAQQGFSGVIVVGADARPIGQAAIEHGFGADQVVYVDDRHQAGSQAQHLLRGGDVVLIKASRAEGLEQVAQHLLEHPTDTVAGVAHRSMPVPGEPGLKHAHTNSSTNGRGQGAASS